jgi:AAA family ATPase
VDLKYLTHTQIVEVVYEGCTRQFSVFSVSSARAASNAAVDQLAEGLQSLSIESKPQVWTIGWDSSVRILEDKVDDRSYVLNKVPPKEGSSELI